MTTKLLLLFDGIINALLGILLIIFPSGFANWLGVPIPEIKFYVNILGAIFVGIAIALFWEFNRNLKNHDNGGLGVVGAAAINLCGGAMLAYWLATGELALNVLGSVFLWMLVILLLGISLFEINEVRE